MVLPYGLQEKDMMDKKCEVILIHFSQKKTEKTRSTLIRLGIFNFKMTTLRYLFMSKTGLSFTCFFFKVFSSCVKSHTYC